MNYVLVPPVTSKTIKMSLGYFFQYFHSYRYRYNKWLSEHVFYHGRGLLFQIPFGEETFAHVFPYLIPKYKQTFMRTPHKRLSSEDEDNLVSG